MSCRCDDPLSVAARNKCGRYPFTPRLLSGCVLWLRADMGVTKDGSNRVSAWADQSGSGNHVTQGTGAAQPLWTTSAAFNNRNVLYFDGGDWLESAVSNWAGVTACTIFIVYRQDATAYKDVFSKGVASTSGGFLLRPQGTGYVQLFTTGAGGYNASGSPTDFPGAAQYRLSWTIDTAQPQATEHSLWSSGTAVGLTNTGPANTTDIASNTAYFVGKHAGATAPLVGHIAEIIVYTRALATAERQAAEAYLTRYAP